MEESLFFVHRNVLTANQYLHQLAGVSSVVSGNVGWICVFCYFLFKTNVDGVMGKDVYASAVICIYF